MLKRPNPLDRILEVQRLTPAKCHLCEISVGLAVYENQYWCPNCLYAKVVQLRKRNIRLRDLLQQWVSGVTRGAAVPKNQLMALLKEELDAQAVEETA